MCSHVFFVIKIYLLYIGVCVALGLALHVCFYKNNKACNAPIPIRMQLFKGQEWHEEWEQMQSSVQICTHQQQSYLLKPSGSRLSSRKNTTCSYDIPSCRQAAVLPQDPTRLERTAPGPYQTGTDCPRTVPDCPRTVPDWNGLPQDRTRLELTAPGPYQTGTDCPRTVPDWNGLLQDHTRLEWTAPGPYQTGTDCPRRLWQPSHWTVLSPGSTHCCKHQLKVPMLRCWPLYGGRRRRKQKMFKKAEFFFFLYSTVQKREPQSDFLHKNIYSPSSNILQLYTVIHQSSFKFTEQHASILKALYTITPD